MLKNKYPAAVEMPSELWVNDKLLTVFMCSPYDLEDLAIGHLLTRGMIKGINEIENINIDKDSFKIQVQTNSEISKEWFSVPEFILSGVSSVDKFNDNIYKIDKVKDIEIKLSEIISSAKTMVDDALIYRETGGVHAAILTEVNGDKFLREDIGRHSAVDKAVGAYARAGKDFSNSFISTTGRISLDMLLKSASMGIPVVVSLKYPSDLGIKLANHYNISIVARILREEPLIYTNKDKIILDI